MHVLYAHLFRQQILTFLLQEDLLLFILPFPVYSSASGSVSAFSAASASYSSSSSSPYSSSSSSCSSWSYSSRCLFLLSLFSSSNWKVSSVKLDLSVGCFGVSDIDADAGHEPAVLKIYLLCLINIISWHQDQPAKYLN